MKKITDFLREAWQFIVMVLLLGVIVFFLFRSCSDRREIKRITAQRDSCYRAPVKTDTIHGSIKIKGETKFIPIYRKQIVHDTVVRLVTTWYDSTYRGNGWRFRWRAVTSGVLDSVAFSDFTIPKEIIIQTKTVDTCFNRPAEYRPLNHWGLSGSLCINNFKQFPAIQLGAFWSIQDRIALRGGVLFVPDQDKNFYGVIGLDIYLDRWKRK